MCSQIPISGKCEMLFSDLIPTACQESSEWSGKPNLNNDQIKYRNYSSYQGKTQGRNKVQHKCNYTVSLLPIWIFSSVSQSTCLLRSPSRKVLPVVILNGLLFWLKLAACFLTGDYDLVSDNSASADSLGWGISHVKNGIAAGCLVLLDSLAQVTFLIYQSFINHKVWEADNTKDAQCQI